MPSTASPPESLLGSLLRFLSHPDWALPQLSQPPRQTCIALLRLYALQLSLILLLSALLHPIQSRFLSVEEHALSEFMSEVSIWQFLFFGTVIAPVVEELIFRLPLRLSALNFTISLSCLAILFLGTGSFLVMVLLGGLIGVGATQLLRRRLEDSPLRALYTRGFKGIFYGSALLFGIVHLSNYLDLQGPWFLAPLLVVPQCVIGLFLGFIRLRYGFVWAVVSHGFHNFLLSSPLILSQFGSEALRQQMTELGETETLELTPLDQGIMTTVALLSLAVVVSCGRTAYRMIQEWLAEE